MNYQIADPVSDYVYANEFVDAPLTANLPNYRYSFTAPPCYWTTINKKHSYNSSNYTSGYYRQTLFNKKTLPCNKTD